MDSEGWGDLMKSEVAWSSGRGNSSLSLITATVLNNSRRRRNV